MITTAAIVVALIFLAAAGFISFSLFRKVNGQKEITLLNLNTLQTELEEKKQILENLAKFSVGLIMAEDRDKAQEGLSAVREAVESEKGRVTILQAEAEAVDIRLRELEEIERELDSSGIEAAREMGMLRAQDKDIEFRNTKLFEMHEEAELLLNRISSNVTDPEVLSLIEKARADLKGSQERLKHFQDELPTLNEKYMSLKRAYDALDIEYAQLYEKQSSKEVAAQ
jgi:hypothetical protein